MSIISNLVNKTVNHSNINILSIPFDGSFEAELSRFGDINIFLDVNTASIGYEKFYNNDAISNIHPINIKALNSHNSVDFDFVLVNDFLNQMPLARQLSSQLHIPILIANHIAPDLITTSEKNLAKNALAGEKIISLCDYIHDGWALPNSQVFSYDYETFDGDPVGFKGHTIIAGQFLQSDYPVIADLKNHIKNLQIFGNNPGLSESHPHIRHIMNTRGTFINLPNNSGISPYLRLAVKYRCRIISSRTPLLEKEFPDMCFVSTTEELISKIGEAKTIEKESNFLELLSFFDEFKYSNYRG